MGQGVGPTIYFAATGPQVIRVQQREDGVIVDQILFRHRSTCRAPGALKNDTVILPASTTAPAPAVTLIRGPYLQQAGSSAATVVWATREAGPAEVRYAADGAAAATAAATSRRVPAGTTGFSYDYYQHEATLTGLAASTSYSYDPYVSGVDTKSGTDQFRTARRPAPAR